LRFILILSFHLRLGLPSGPFLSSFPTKISYKFLIPHACYIAQKSHTPWFDIIPTLCGIEHRLWSSSLCSFLRNPVFSSVLGDIISLSFWILPGGLTLTEVAVDRVCQCRFRGRPVTLVPLPFANNVSMKWPRNEQTVNHSSSDSGTWGGDKTPRGAKRDVLQPILQRCPKHWKCTQQISSNAIKDNK
jgi:hypothetical protein